MRCYQPQIAKAMQTDMKPCAYSQASIGRSAKWFGKVRAATCGMRWYAAEEMRGKTVWVVQSINFISMWHAI